MVNAIVLFAYNFLVLISHTFKSKSAGNRKYNENIISKIEEDKMIEDQSVLSEVLIGNRNISYCGCGVIAVYNALLSLKGKMAVSDFLNIIQSFEKKGLTLNGIFGISPVSIKKYFQKTGYDTASTKTNKDEELNSFGQNFDTFICTIFHKKNNPKYGIHHIAITKNDSGKYVVHNPYRESDTLSGAIKSAARYNGSALYTIGIKA